MSDEFISELVQPVEGTTDTRRMARGEPGLPGRFIWRGQEHVVAELLEQWKQTSPCTSGSPELYVRKHWYRIRTTDGRQMTIYFERQARSRRERKARWWLYTVSSA